MLQTSQILDHPKSFLPTHPPLHDGGVPQGPPAGAGSQTPALPDPGKTFNQADLERLIRNDPIPNIPTFSDHLAEVPKKGSSIP